jgi:hypothetical protein
MNLIVIVLAALLVWMAYIMYNSYRAMEKELREIRLKCMGTTQSKYQEDPTEKVKGTLLSVLGKLASMSA